MIKLPKTVTWLWWVELVCGCILKYICIWRFLLWFSLPLPPTPYWCSFLCRLFFDRYALWQPISMTHYVSLSIFRKYVMLFSSYFRVMFFFQGISSYFVVVIRLLRSLRPRSNFRCWLTVYENYVINLRNSKLFRVIRDHNNYPTSVGLNSVGFLASYHIWRHKLSTNGVACYITFVSLSQEDVH